MKGKLLHGFLALLLMTTVVAPHLALADGSAKAQVTVDGQKYSFSGGTCIQQGTVLSLGIGTAPSGPNAPNQPDYFGAYIPDIGNFTDGAITVVKDGKEHELGTAQGQATKSGATFSGTPMMQPNVHVSGSFTC